MQDFFSSNYNHSGNFKQHLLKHERESGSISAILVAKSKDGDAFSLAGVIRTGRKEIVIFFFSRDILC